MSYFTEPRLSACIVVDDQGRKALRTVQCFQESETELELHVVHNMRGGYLGESLSWQCPGALYYPQRKDLGFAAACNVPLGNLRSEYHVICAPDISFTPQMLGYMIGYMDDHPECTILSPKVIDKEGKEIPQLRSLPTIRSLLGMWLKHWPGPFKGWYAVSTMGEGVTTPTYAGTAPGCFLMIRTHKLRELQGFDPAFRRILADCDLSLYALEKGAAIVYHPEMYVTRDLSQETGKRRKRGQGRDVLRFLRKWGWKW